MLLVVGGIASGKHTYVHSLGFAPEDCSASPHDATPVLHGLEELLREGELDERDFEAVAAKQVVICREVGLGVVPLGADERAWRERVGRTCGRLAKRADRVVRLVCGIPVTLDSTTETGR